MKNSICLLFICLAVGACQSQVENDRIEYLMPTAGGDTFDNKDFDKINCTKREVSVPSYSALSKSEQEEWKTFESMPDRDWFFTYLYKKYCN